MTIANQELIREAGFEPNDSDATGQALMKELKRRHGAYEAEVAAQG
jgi:uncharacterized protein YihD (DUF1040 family)